MAQVVAAWKCCWTVEIVAGAQVEVSLTKVSRKLIQGPVGTLELRLDEPRAGQDVARYCAVLCHPHPLYGGTMENKVVATLARTYRDLGIPAVRFNFRGVGASAGEHDAGRGEVDDLLSVANWATAHYGTDRLLVAGFSFGAAVAAAGADKLPLHHLTVVAPPVDRYGMNATNAFRCPVCVLVGEQDEVVDAAAVRRWATQLSPPATVLSFPEASHFFHGELVNLRDQVRTELRAALPLVATQ